MDQSERLQAQLDRHIRGRVNPYKKVNPDGHSVIVTSSGGIMHDPVNHPSHYTQHPSGVECITVTEHMNFNIGNAVKYLWRAGLKGITTIEEIEDLRKAQWYINREIERISQCRPQKK